MEKEEEHQKPSNENNVSDSMSEDNQTKKQNQKPKTKN